MYKFDNEKEEEAEKRQPAMSSLNETSKDILSIVVRMCGLMLLFIGLWIAIQVFSEALDLYKDPTNIERMAKAIETGSNIDKSITPIRDSILGEDGVENETESKSNTKAKSNADTFRISYFIAWVVDLLLLLLLARISIMAIKTGGELALYDAQIKKFARQIVKANKD
jgi:hypothetical protein